MTVGTDIETAMPELGAVARRARRSVLPTIERALVKMGPVRATAVLVFSGIVFGELIHLAIWAFVHPLFNRSMLACATLVTVIVATPIIFRSQILIRRLVRSRRNLGDLTEKLAVALDEAQVANEAKSRFFANANHELRTPLNAIIGFSQMLSTQSLGPIGLPRYVEYADDIHRSAQHLLALVNDILELARGQSPDGKRDADGDCDLRQTIDEALRMVWPAAESGGVRLDHRIAAEVHGLRANDRMVKQILLNLLSNAVKFAPGGEVLLTARIAGDGCLVIETADTGIGMSTADIAVALTPFGQVSNTITRAVAGTGLGLPLAKAMMEMHDGTLRIDSEAGRGTVVSLTFPAARAMHRAVPTGTVAYSI
jgi:two-component system, cell cycle sensor histidine kinase PleC